MSMDKRKEDVSLLLQFLSWVFEKVYSSFMERGWKTKIAILLLAFLVFFWLVTKNIDLILSPFHRENGSTKDHFVWFVEGYRPPVADCHVVFVSWLVLIPIVTILTWRFKPLYADRGSILIESQLIFTIPFLLGVKWAFFASFFFSDSRTLYFDSLPF